MPDDLRLEHFYRAVSVDELIAIRQAGGLVLNGTEIFITQEWAYPHPLDSAEWDLRYKIWAM